MTEYQDQPQNAEIGDRISTLAGAAKLQGSNTVIKDRLDANGNLLGMLDALQGRMHEALERLTGPMPMASGPRNDQEKPCGDLHIMGVQQDLMREKIENILGQVDQLNHLV